MTPPPSSHAASQTTYLLFVLTCLFVTMAGNLVHHHIADPHTLHRRSMESFQRAHLLGPTRNQPSSNHSSTTTTTTSSSPLGHSLAGLHCADHNGPSDDMASELIYWEDVPSDSAFRSPLRRNHNHNNHTSKKYLTFEPDGGGFNNIRMSLETMVVLAHAMGRTLVLPPSQGHYLLRNDRDKQRTHFSFNDFYHLEQVGYEHAGMEIVTMDEFLQRMALTGQLVDTSTNEVRFPPYNRTNWDGYDPKEWKDYLRNVTLTPLDWTPGNCLAAFPSEEGPHHLEELETMMTMVKEHQFPKVSEFVDHPVNVDGSTVERLREAVAGQVRRLCLYDAKMQEAPVIHFMCYHKMRVRMLTHFYAFLFFEDWRQDLWSKRFVRDHLRYSDEIQCAAARVIAAIRERAKNPTRNPNGDFDSMHIRRGDFQYKQTQISAQQIYENSKQELTEGSVVFIATDHKKRSFFQPLAEKYDLVFLNDFRKELEGVNTNYFGMIDQLVASRGRVFFGCYQSTFSGFIIRMRAYHAMRDESIGWEKGVVPNTFFYTGQREKEIYQTYFPLSPPYYQKEFPTAWRGINAGITELEAMTSST